MKFAKDRGYHDVSYRCEYEKYSIYEMQMEEKETYIGLPQFLIVGEDAFRIVNEAETFQILDYIGSLKNE